MRVLIILLMLCAAPVWSANSRLVASLSIDRVEVTTGDAASELIVFGAIRQELIDTEAGPVEVVVTLSGPEMIETIYRKDRQFGIWVTVDSQVLGRSPVFYSVNSTGPLGAILQPETDAIFAISDEQRVLPAARGDDNREALMRLRRDAGDFVHNEGSVTLTGGVLFNTAVALPANLTEGFYEARIFLLQDGRVMDRVVTAVDVRKAGIERWVYLLANRHRLIYALTCVMLAGALGWLASTLFRRV